PDSTLVAGGYNVVVTGSGHLALAPEIDEFRREFERLAAEADALVAPLSEEQFMWQPSPGSWSVAQCLDHLNATARMYLPRLDEGIAEAMRRGLYGEGPFAHDFIGKFFVRTMEPPPRLKVKAPASFHPAPQRSRAEIMAAFRAYQVQFVDRLRQASGLDLRRAKVMSPASTWIKMSLNSGFALMVAHERRHLWQAQQVLAAPGFPG
ncbi:MAG TPA: DinB family protein, partial [Vicinamibacterales bacterium]|nr:DinB family protein [Vicinamibacterales bacterium]